MMSRIIMPVYFFVGAALLFSDAGDALAGAGNRNLPSSGAVWSRFSFAPSGFKWFVLARASEAATARQNRFRPNDELKKHFGAMPSIMPTYYAHREAQPDSSNKSRYNERIKLDAMQRRSNVGADPLNGSRNVSVKPAPAAKIARVDPRKAQPSTSSRASVTRAKPSRAGTARLTGRSRSLSVGAGNRAPGRYRGRAATHRKVVMAARRRSPNVQSFLYETPEWARRAFLAD